MNAAVDVFKEFTPNKYNSLLPNETSSQLSPLHKMAVNVVQISTDEGDKEVYKQNSEYAITKRGLLKFASAANIQIVEIKKVPPSSCEKCLEMARATGKPSVCATCPSKSDVAYEVTISIPDPAGGKRIVKSSREFICEDERGKMSSDAQYKQAFPFRGAMTESKALTRALRAALAIKATYKADELRKPFAVPVIVPDATDPEMKRAMIERFKSETNALYGGQSQQQALSGGHSEIISVDVDDEELGDIQIDSPEYVETLSCHACGKEIFEVKTPKKTYSPEEWAAGTKRRFGTTLCPACYEQTLKDEQGAA